MSVTFVHAVLNTAADEKSRVFTSETSEWTLDGTTFNMIKNWAPDMNFDLFASHLNNKFPHFCSWMPTPGCSHVDAFTFDWNSKICYCFPPSSLYLKCFDHIRTAKVTRVYFIVPWHQTAVWFPLMLNLLVGEPLFLPRKTAKNLFLLFEDKINLRVHPLHRSMRLAFIHLSGI